MSINVVVKVKLIANAESLHEDDKEVAGDYPIGLQGSIDEKSIADAALDVFHENVPIKVLDDFDFEVWQQLETDPLHEGGSLSWAGKLS